VNVPAGTLADITATKGNFSVTASATPGAGPVTLVIPASAANLAYVSGAYDNIQTILTDLGFEPSELFAADLATTNLSSYDAVFLNCGLDDLFAADFATTTALRAYVEGGGTLYASDHAYSYVVATFPGKVNMIADIPTLGFPTDAPVTAQVVDPELQAALGRATARIMFDYGAWAVIESAGAGTEVLITGPATYYDPITYDPVSATKPYAVQFASGSGRVTYTSFHNEAQATADMQIILESMVFGL
jgi:hypothetical protein